MDFFRIELCPVEDESLCILRDGPAGTQAIGYRMAGGEPARDRYPADARWEMSPKYPGIKLASLIANTGSLLVVRRELKEVFEKEGPAVECYGFDLYDHRKRLASRDYFIVNPLGTFDCLDLRASSIVYGDTPAEIVRVKEMVLDPRKVERAPAFFRVKEEPRAILVGRDFGKKLGALQPTNFFARQVRVAS